MSHCPICHSLYAEKDVKLVNEKLRVRLYHSMCRSCRHGLFAYVMEQPSGVSSIGLVTDASGEDALRLAGKGGITGDECISAHRLLLDKSRDLCRRLLDISGKLA